MKENFKDFFNKKSGQPLSRMAPKEKRIFVANIPYELKWQDVKALFQENVGGVKTVDLFFDQYDQVKSIFGTHCH